MNFHSGQFVDFFEQAPLGVLICNREGRIEDLNQTAATMFGVDRAYAHGVPLAELVHPGEVAGFQTFLGRVLEEPEWRQTELRLRGTEPRSIQLHGLAAMMSDGARVIRLAAVDVTERKAAEAVQTRANRALRALNAVNQAVREAEDESSLLGQVCRFLSSEAGYALAWVGAPVHDEVGSIRYLAGAGRTGYLERVWPTMTWADYGGGRGPFGRVVVSGRPVTHPNLEADLTFAPWRQAALGEGLQSMAALPLNGDGQVMGVLGLYAEDLDAFGDEEMRWLTQLADELATAWYSLRLRAEHRRLERERDVLVELLDATPDFIGIADPEGNALYTNQGGRRILGFSPDQSMEGYTVERAHPPWAARLVLEEGFPTAREKGVWHGEVAFLDAQGREVPFSQTLLAHYDENGDVERFSTIAHDLSDFRRRHTEMERHRRLMALGELGSILAHQLNQPLAAASNYFEGGLKRLKGIEEVPVSLTNGLSLGLQQVHRAGEVVRNIRNFLRGGPPEFQEVDLNDLIRRMVPGLSPEETGRNFRLQVDLAEVLPKVAVDPILIKECLLNLVYNAAEAAGPEEEEPVAVVVRTVETREGVEVQVEDRGPGLPEALRENLDQPLFTTKDQGMGLGLSLCRSVVEGHGGQLWATENRGEPGTTFHFTLPVEGSRGSA